MLKKSLLVVACAGLPAAAQDIHNDVAPQSPQTDPGVSFPVMEALGDAIGDPFNVEGLPGRGTLNPTPATGGLASLGVTVAFDHVWVSNGDGIRYNTGCVTGGVMGAGAIMKFDLDGNWLETYEQAPQTSGTCWGYRDGAKDEANNKLWWGTDGDRVDEFDYDPGTGDITFNQTYNNFGSNGTVRAFARRGTTGNFYHANFGGLISEIDLSSGVPVEVGVYLNLSGPGGTGSGSMYGMGYDAQNDTFWAWTQNADPLGDPDVDVHAIELDPNNDMMPTGREFYGADISGDVNNIAGGADVFIDPRCDGDVQVFAGLHQATPDQVQYYELDQACVISSCYPDCTGEGTLDIFDFLCFQDAFTVMDPYADCTGEGTFDIFDFLCFQDAFTIGCP